MLLSKKPVNTGISGIPTPIRPIPSPAVPDASVLNLPVLPAFFLIDFSDFRSFLSDWHNPVP